MSFTEMTRLMEARFPDDPDGQESVLGIADSIGFDEDTEPALAHRESVTLERFHGGWRARFAVIADGKERATPWCYGPTIDDVIALAQEHAEDGL